MMLSFTCVGSRRRAVPMRGKDVGLGLHKTRNDPVVHFLVRPPICAMQNQRTGRPYHQTITLNLLDTQASDKIAKRM
jgi:hypothetical protein